MNTKSLNIIKNTIFSMFVLLYSYTTIRFALSYFDLPKFLIQTDVVSFLTGAKIIKDGKSNLIYDLNTQYEYQNIIVTPDKKHLLPYRNFPIVAVFYLPLLEMSLKNSFIIIFFINIFLIFLFHFIFRFSFPELSKYKLLFLFPLLFYPSVSNLIVGQYTVVVLLILLLIYLSIKKDKSFWAGFITSILLIKPQYLLFTPFAYFLTKDKKKYLMGIFCGFVLFITLNLLITRDLKPLLEYPNFLLATETSGFGSRPYQMFTLYGLSKTLLPNLANLYLLAGNFIFYLLAVFFTIKKAQFQNSPERLFSAGVILTILFSVHALTHDLTILLIPIYIFLIFFKRIAVISKILLVLVLIGALPLYRISIFETLVMISIYLFILNDKNSYAPEHHKNDLRGD